jgi:hypothetical protein
MSVRKLLSSALRSRFVATALREVPPRDCSKLFSPLHQMADVCWKKNVHMIGSTSMLGRTHHSQLSNFVSRNGTHNFYFWNDQTALEFMSSRYRGSKILEVYHDVPHNIVKADIFRLCVLAELGGFYFDMKSRLDASLESINFYDRTGYLVEEVHRLDCEDITGRLNLPGKRRLANWFLAFPPGHSLLKYAISELVLNYENWDRSYGNDFPGWVRNFSGPKMLTRATNRYWNEIEPVQVIPFDCYNYRPVYACKGSWVRKLIKPHYTSSSYLL